MVYQVKDNSSPGNRAIIYARVSGDDSKTEGINIKSQIEMCRGFAAQNKYVVVKELVEDERLQTSGASLDLPELSRLLEMARAGEYDILLARDITRISRDAYKMYFIKDQLSKAGVRVEYATTSYEDSDAGRLHEGLDILLADHERRTITLRTKRGRENAARSGSVMVFGSPPYGYRLVKDKHRFALEIDEPEAMVVRRIFDHYVVDGWSMNRIASELTDERIPSPLDKKNRMSGGFKKERPYGHWSSATIGKILNRRAYVGKWEYGKRKYTKTPDGKRKSIKRAEPLSVVDVPRIISDEMWEKTQEKRRYNKRTAKRNRKNNYLLAGHVSCGFCAHAVCGTPITPKTSSGQKTTYLYYVCNTARKPEDSKDPCPSPPVYYPARILDPLVKGWIREIITDTDRLQSSYESYAASLEKINEPTRRRLEFAERSLEAAKQKRQRWLNLYGNGLLEEDELTKLVNEVDNEIQQYEQKQEELEEFLAQQTFSPDHFETLKAFANELKEGIELMSDDFSAWRWIIEQLRTEIQVLVEDDEKVAYATIYFGKQKLEKQRLSIISTTTCGNFQNSNPRRLPPGLAPVGPLRERHRLP